MKKNTVIILLLALLLICVFNTNIRAELKTYYQSAEEVDSIINQMKDRMRNLENSTIPELRSKIGDLIQVHQNSINDQEEYIDYYKQLYEEDEEAFEKRVEVYRENIEFYRRLISLLQNFREVGLSQINSEGRNLVNKLSEIKGLTWNSGLNSLETLAGIYWANFEIEKLDELINSAYDNKVRGISDEKRDSLIADYEQRYTNKSSDPGDYWHSSRVVLIEKPLYNALYRLGQEYNALDEEEKQQLLQINDESNEDSSEELEELAVNEEIPDVITDDDTQEADIDSVDDNRQDTDGGNGEDEQTSSINGDGTTEDDNTEVESAEEEQELSEVVPWNRIEGEVNDRIGNYSTSVSAVMSRGTLIKLGSQWGDRAGQLIHARLNFSLKSGDQIFCNHNGYSIMEIYSPGSVGNHIEATLWPESKAVIRDSANIEINKGFLHVVSEDVQENSDQEKEGYNIITPSATLNMRGTNLITYVDEKKNTAIFLKEGEIVVQSNSTDQEVELDSGHIVIILANGRIAPVEKMTEKDSELFAYNMKDLITADTIDPTSLKNGLYFTSYKTEKYFNLNGHPVNTAEMNQFFNEENIGINYHYHGIYGRDVDWIDYNKPTYLPDNYFSLLLGGYIYIPEDGTYTFALDSDDASDLFINNQLVVSWYGSHTMANNYEQTGEIYLTRGYHLIQVRLEEGQGETGLRLAWKEPNDFRFNKIPAEQFYIDKTDFID
ncbi:MAG: PA14 domain-containing protein [Halanaerobiales bacterium]